MSGISMDEVRVHRNSPEPAKLGALAYTQGNQIHLGPGQEKHLGHEAWHVVQQAQGRVKPTMELNGLSINDENGLESEARQMGPKVSWSRGSGGLDGLGSVTKPERIGHSDSQAARQSIAQGVTEIGYHPQWLKAVPGEQASLVGGVTRPWLDPRDPRQRTKPEIYDEPSLYKTSTNGDNDLKKKADVMRHHTLLLEGCRGKSNNSKEETANWLRDTATIDIHNPLSYQAETKRRWAGSDIQTRGANIYIPSKERGLPKSSERMAAHVRNAIAVAGQAKMPTAVRKTPALAIHAQRSIASAARQEVDAGAARVASFDAPMASNSQQGPTNAIGRTREWQSPKTSSQASIRGANALGQAQRPNGKFNPPVQRAGDGAAQQQPLIQKNENNTGLPDKLKSGAEKLSAYFMDDVKVHYDSDRPSQLQDHAYAQGTNIHLDHGQEKHLPYETWHVAQQKQGRVNPTEQMKYDVKVNDDTGLEKEADTMGAEALHYDGGDGTLKDQPTTSSASQLQPVIQRWSIALIDEERDRISDMDENFGGNIALHHIVSRDFITKMIKFINQIATSSGRAARDFPQSREAAQNFLKSVNAAVDASFQGEGRKAFKRQTEGRAGKVLHNLPVNLVAGPASPVGDPGTRIDPATVLNPARGAGEDDRIMDQRSQLLTKMLTHFDQLKAEEAKRKEAKSDKAAAGALTNMGKTLLAAVQSMPTPSEIAFDPDEWYDVGGRYTRKQLGKYRDRPTGEPLFVAARVAPTPIPGLAYNIPAMACGANRTLALNIPAAQITHIFQRHSYDHFNFNYIKLRNAFWAAGTTVPAIRLDIENKAQQVLSHLAAELAEDPEEDLDGKAINLKLPGLFCIAKIVAVGFNAAGHPTQFSIAVETIAPDGQDQYTGDVLNQIHVNVP